jgi:hypothetical protein
MFFRCLAVFGHFLVHRIYFLDFYVKHKFPCFRTLEEHLEKRPEYQVGREAYVQACPISSPKKKELKEGAASSTKSGD